MNTEPQADIAVIGLAVMGQNLILNMNDHGFTVAAFNRTVSKVEEFLARIIHQPKKSIREGVSRAKRSLATTVSQAHHAPKTSSSAHPDTVPSGLMDAIRRSCIVSALWGLHPALCPCVAGALA